MRNVTSQNHLPPDPEALAETLPDALPDHAPKSASPNPLQQARCYPQLRYMGSKSRLLPWIYDVFRKLEFNSALDPFCGSGCVAYLLKTMRKRVTASDFLKFSATFARATIENNRHILNRADIRTLLHPNRNAPNFIQRTFSGIFYTDADLRFLDQVSANIPSLANSYKRDLAMSALLRSCLKKQPRGVFTVSGDLTNYNDGRRDLCISLEEHFLEQIDVFNSIVFNNGQKNHASKANVFRLHPRDIDLVYLDPPYVPRSDDNCYIKRYHFLEGLSSYWQNERIDYSTKVRKIAKRYTPFSYRRKATEAFAKMFARFRNSIIVLSYSSNGYPDLDALTNMLQHYKKHISVFEKPHRYHFGNHDSVNRSETIEYLIVGR